MHNAPSSANTHACKGETERPGAPTLLVLDLGLHVLDRVRGLHLQGDGLSGQGFNLHACTEVLSAVVGRERSWEIIVRARSRRSASCLLMIAKRVGVFAKSGYDQIAASSQFSASMICANDCVCGPECDSACTEVRGTDGNFSNALMPICS